MLDLKHYEGTSPMVIDANEFLENFADKDLPVIIPRKGCHDIWNAFMVKNATFSYPSDIPFCPCTATSLPAQLISYDDAKSLYKKEIKVNPDFHINAYIHFYIDDQKFDGKRDSIWFNCEKALNIFRHFDGIITPDFSTYADFPDPLKRYNTYRMRALGNWASENKISVINNVRWGTSETWDYCFDGIPQKSIVAVGTVASGLKKSFYRPQFETGLRKMVETISPKAIIVFGSVHYDFFDDLKKVGVEIVDFPSRTNEVFARRKSHE